jgi:hypothetical protein
MDITFTNKQDFIDALEATRPWCKRVDRVTTRAHKAGTGSR